MTSEIKCGTCGEVEPEKWIKCSDELPEIGQTVLIYEDGDILMSNFDNEDGWFGVYRNDKVTHWRALPEPPK